MSKTCRLCGKPGNEFHWDGTALLCPSCFRGHQLRGEAMQLMFPAASPAFPGVRPTGKGNAPADRRTGHHGHVARTTGGSR